MRIWIAVLALALVGCANDNKRDGDTAARKAGRAAYEATQETKKVAKKAGQELKKAGEQAQQGWDEARKEAPPKGPQVISPRSAPRLRIPG
jgi:hypothetical protein